MVTTLAKTSTTTLPWSQGKNIVNIARIAIENTELTTHTDKYFVEDKADKSKKDYYVIEAMKKELSEMKFLYKKLKRKKQR